MRLFHFEIYQGDDSEIHEIYTQSQNPKVIVPVLLTKGGGGIQFTQSETKRLIATKIPVQMILER